jgi:hypothetical protein
MTYLEIYFVACRGYNMQKICMLCRHSALSYFGLNNMLSHSLL